MQSRAEELLKSISETLKKHEDFLNHNPELFDAIEDRLLKAIDYEDWEGESDEEEEDSIYNHATDLFDDPEEDSDYDEDEQIEEDEASKWLEENDPETHDKDDTPHRETADVPGEEYGVEDAPKKDLEEVKPKKKGRYTEWQPKDDYEDHHKEAMDKYMEEGYSHREAERMAGAHDAPSDFYSALRHHVKPSEPSPKMLEQMRGHAQEWLKQAERKQMETADPEKSPVKYASGQAIASHDEAHNDFSQAYHEFLQSDDIKGLKGRERHKAIREWKKQWNEENPDYKDKAVAAAESGKKLQEATEARKQRREEGEQAILEAGKTAGPGSSGQYSEAASGGTGGMSQQAAAQSVGGEKGESGYTSGTAKDPAAVFAEQHPEYVEHLRSKLTQKLSDDQHQRLAGVDSFKNKSKNTQQQGGNDA